MGKKQRTSTTSITIDVMSGDAPTVQLFVESKNSKVDASKRVILRGVVNPRSSSSSSDNNKLELISEWSQPNEKKTFDLSQALLTPVTIYSSTSISTVIRPFTMQDGGTYTFRLSSTTKYGKLLFIIIFL